VVDAVRYLRETNGERPQRDEGGKVKVLRVLAAGLGSIALVAVGATSATAGEVTGNGKVTPIVERANSICAYSGLNDDTAEEPGRTQSYGQVVRAGFKAFAPSPGTACNGHRGFLAGGGH
jgi:hypothetical protein